MENLEVKELKAQIESLSQRIAVLEVSRTENAAESEGGGALDPSVPRKELLSVPNAIHPFYVTCDGRETDPWLVYLPDGCCKYGDFTPDAIQPEPDSTTHLADLQDDTKNGGIYAHLYLELDDDSDSDSSTEPEVVGFPLLSIDTTPTQTPSEENIKVINIKIATITDGAVAQNVSSALILGGSGGGGGGETYTPDPSPFRLIRSQSEDPETHQPILVWTIANCKFYWDGVLKTLQNFTPPATGTVYLCCTQEAPSSSGEQEWQFTIATSEAQAPSGGRAVNFKLYDLSDYSVTCDYRTTFLGLNSPHKVAMFTVEKPSGEDNPSVTLDATTNDAVVTARKDATHTAELKADSTGGKLSLSAGEKSASIDPSEMENGNATGFHTLTVKHADGTEDKYDVIANDDITVVEASGTVLKDIALAYDTSTHQFTMTKTTVDLETGEETVGDPETIFTAVPHSSNS